MDLQAYQERSRETARYPRAGADALYPTLGLCGEAGEVAEKVKKVLRDNDGRFDPEAVALIALELGDVLWYVAQLATELDLRLEDIAEQNLAKLASRAARNVLGGSGDRR
jgi:NTP pyrophosphatase (non-canonical NTP hydrolase)